jgi:hypothetical protein
MLAELSRSVACSYEGKEAGTCVMCVVCMPGVPGAEDSPGGQASLLDCFVRWGNVKGFR